VVAVGGGHQGRPDAAHREVRGEIREPHGTRVAGRQGSSPLVVSGVTVTGVDINPAEPARLMWWRAGPKCAQTSSGSGVTAPGPAAG
jgi:hypothetical protein